MSYRIPANVRTAIMTEAGYLRDIVNTAVELSFRTADIECRNAPEEPDKVLSFFIEGLDHIENAFNRRLHPHKVHLSVSGIFTHQTPKVTLSTTAFAGNSCELADLCLLVTYGQQLERGGLGNALLLQAKNDLADDADDVQCALYEEESRFTYKSPKALAGKAPNRRDLPSKFEPALAYWELGAWPWHRFPEHHGTSLFWADHLKTPSPSNVNFGAALIDLFRGTGGYGFRRPEANAVGWSRILFDLIEVTASQAARRRNLKVRDPQRGCGRLARQFLQYAHTPDCPYAVRNSLAETLAFYSDEFAEAGRRIEADDGSWASEKFMADEEPAPKDNDPSSGGGGEPPVLGKARPEGPDEDGGAGNLIFFHFTSL